MDNLLPTNEFTEVEGRQYINPQVSLDETTSFINNLRSTQNQQNQEIAKQTNMLGTDIPSIKGGLIGADSYFTSRYQTPQTNAAVSNLRAAAQAQALNQALANEQTIWKKRYNDAYRSYQKRAASRAAQLTSPTSGAGELLIDTNANGGGEKIDISQYTGGEYVKGKYYPGTKEGTGSYYDTSGNWWTVSRPTFRDVYFGATTNPFNKKEVGNVVDVNGRKYVYLDSGVMGNQDPAWYPVSSASGPVE